MIRTGIGFGIGFALGWAIWRNVPTFGQAYPESFWLLAVLTMFVCWWAGRYWRARDHERAVARASAMAAAEIRAEIKASSQAHAQAASVVNVTQSPGLELVTPAHIIAQWGSDEEMDEEIAAHYAHEINRERLRERNGATARHPSVGDRPTKVLYLPQGTEPPA